MQLSQEYCAGLVSMFGYCDLGLVISELVSLPA